MEPRPPRKSRPPLDEAKLHELALRYVGRFATSRAKFRSYLQRKLRERGWDGSVAPDPDGLVERFAGLGYIDDREFALAKARSLTSRGYGRERLRQALSVAGIGGDEAAEAQAIANAGAVESALRFARRKRFGPFSPQRAEARDRERAIASMVRAGHAFALSRAILDLDPGEGIDDGNLEQLQNRFD
jgi:regulatory protein